MASNKKILKNARRGLITTPPRWEHLVDTATSEITTTTVTTTVTETAVTPAEATTDFRESHPHTTTRTKRPATTRTKRTRTTKKSS